jgi:two-component system heavy metal sensor histidine kinase CusS
MFSKPIEPRSIASQLVLLFTLAAAFLISCALGVFYVMVVRHAFEEDNQFLADKLVALRADLNTADGPQALNSELKSARAGQPTTYWVRVLDSKGDIVAETPKMGELLAPIIFPQEGQNSVFPRRQDYQTGGKLFSLATTSEQLRGQHYTIQVAQDRSADAQFTRQFGGLVSLVLILAILASAVIAITLTRRGLRPLSDMTHALMRVGATNLDQRVAPVGWPRELQPLALAFDEMLTRLEDSFQRLSQFSADLAHELRTPVANLLGEAQVALSRNRTPEEYREVIESSVAEFGRLSGIIDNLLFLARADSAADHINRTVFDARTALEKLVEFYETVAEEQRVEITCTGHGEIYADFMLFSRAVSNLVENALHFTPAGGTIQVALATGSKECVISVADTGCGIAPEVIPRVFDRLYRADSSRSSQGTGLGLALVKSIANLHGGSATVRSEIGGGTTVTMTFPGRASSLSGT